MKMTERPFSLCRRTTSRTFCARSAGKAAVMPGFYEAFDAGDAKADDSIRDVQQSGRLTAAVEACCRAAACEFRLADQRQARDS